VPSASDRCPADGAARLRRRLLSVATGVANTGPTTPLAFADLVPAAVRQVAGDTGTLAGFLLVAAADGGPNG
jgi:hypothetical protein